MEKYFDNILLEEEQRVLLMALVEAWRSLPREDRHNFIFIQTFGGSEIIGLDNFPNPYKGDIVALGREDLLNISYGSRSSLNFDITPLGFKYYENLKRKSGEPIQEVEGRVINFLESEPFRKKHPEAYSKWAQAMELLWSSDSQRELSAIGHHCREAVQYFATSLVEQYPPDQVTSEINKPVKRVEAVLSNQGETLGRTYQDVLMALFELLGRA
jgi:hypothetical protein